MRIRLIDWLWPLDWSRPLWWGLPADYPLQLWMRRN